MAFDTAITPTASTPASTSNATLFTAAADTSVMVDVVNLSTSTQTVRVGITPSGGSVHWRLYDVDVPIKDALHALGPWVIQSGDAVTVAVGSTGSVVTFSVTGVKS